MIKKCNDKFNFGCTLEINTDNQDISQFFDLKKTHSGDYYLNYCKECRRKHFKSKYKSGDWNYNNKKKSSKFIEPRDYGSLVNGKYNEFEESEG